jgi:hypothetical protein
METDCGDKKITQQPGEYLLNNHLEGCKDDPETLYGFSMNGF